ncbi:DUF3558 domain-containing protein [Haloactinomyces albus]|uniref:DUF3558 domain-containing protein n=1 Tax=Haloactinomyces albus TaxID=1352928 RepID=A0AAE3ZAJ8_9ACTN|nr:DUF3558 domain-containing protein [Haloactinomyces albus]MDR7301337.1 hypothetical protein [Haloactinomyces albus]
MHSSLLVGRQRRFGTLVAGTLLVSGCGFVQTENATGIVGATEPALSETVSASPPSTAPLPPRPADLPLNGIDPCELLTAQQRARLGFDREPLTAAAPGFGNVATCNFRNSTAQVGARLSLVTGESMDVWTSDAARVRATPVEIAGFPALVVRTPELNLACNVAVDVAEGQHVDVLYRNDGANPPPPLHRLCAGAKRVAEAAVTRLKEPSPSKTSSSPSPSPTVKLND